MGKISQLKKLRGDSLKEFHKSKKKGQQGSTIWNKGKTNANRDLEVPAALQKEEPSKNRVSLLSTLGVTVFKDMRSPSKNRS